ncbi:tRNA (adenosine(37)-N6)-threonylcarbamoyltransferase complex dimerization subunit type 1 TsaB [Actinophytocola algeriensis]|uniref:tRNA threonylcarbamoyl adenosine modification protein YeaZ n=1 Tax=Actinophytocola algeriensis TaxID=1768010 RepID=A0A7W7QEJ0_9PSEU|nr:tRNA (adenosine(37)-N6)-threonylcarbamoyltransferase complex dimerization subunit type 1 TsaB [Actinophytocola algeriensis]MBB4912054.1 tRNA threonylcarbamoyl adenosine modification protein YeaZ [Actinophytocola algeriensis]MBE1477454.1 tRNA threonylcarbamoyl adenosine modification protein YeaZ [Actinophytocola algeriensis]
MLVIAVDTATPAVTAGVVNVEEMLVLAECVTVDAKAHGELLTPHILTALKEADRTFADIAAIVCGIGPGPFTGLRAGMATAAALGQALGKPVYPVCTLDAIAAENVADSPLLVASDARRKEIYWATYDATGRRVTNPAVDKPADVVERIPSLSVERVAGNGATLYDLGLPHTGQEYPNPLGIAMVARDDVLAGAKPRPFVPLYLRRPDATEPGARKRVTTR